MTTPYGEGVNVTQPRALSALARFLWVSAIDLVFDSLTGLFWVVSLVGLVSLGIVTLPLAGIGLVFLVAASALLRVSNVISRMQASSLYEIRIDPPVRRLASPSGFWALIRQPFEDLVDPVTWRTLLHHLISLLLGGALASLWWACVRGVGQMWNAGWGGWAVLATLGIALFICAYLYVAGTCDRWLSQLLLGPSAQLQLRQQVDTLAGARQGAIDAASIERQRIERDLHDGVQPQLVALALTLGRAKHKFDDDPEKTRELLDQAHSEAKSTITTLRQLARGIHPAVLTDRGLDAALSAVVSRCAVPVELSVGPLRGIGAEAEAVIYFAVAEALTNVDKHSQATSCSVQVELLPPRQAGEPDAPGRVRALIRDNGQGGAREGIGLSQGGLVGMRERVRAAGGELSIASPLGGPTTVTVEVPCVL